MDKTAGMVGLSAAYYAGEIVRVIQQQLHL